MKEQEIKLPIPENITNDELKEKLFQTQQGIRNPDYLLPNFKTLVKELNKPHVTKGLLWTEYLVQCKTTHLKAY